MADSFQRNADILRTVLAAIAPRLSEVEAADLTSLIDAGEFGAAVDTVFCTIDEDEIPLSDAVLAKLRELEGLYNTVGDLDPQIARNVLRDARRPSPFRM